MGVINNGLYYYKLHSPYPEDVTKECKLTINEIDSNFFNLKNADISKAEIVRNEDDDQKLLVLTRNDGQTIAVDLNAITFDLDVSSVDNEDGSIDITIVYSGEGGKKEVTFSNVVTLEGAREIIKEEMKVVTDGTLKGMGTQSSPLGISNMERTGMLAPVNGVIDTTKGESLPSQAELGARFITVEYVDDYGLLYNGRALAKISEQLEEDGRGWRIPTKSDWDNLLNSIEPCRYRNHDSEKCHVGLGKFAGKFLKSTCGWVGQEECSCSGNTPITSYTDDITACDPSFDPYDGTFDDDTMSGDCHCHGNGGSADDPSGKCINPKGIDKYGFGILPTGIAYLDAYGRPQYDNYTEKAYFWTTTHIGNNLGQDVYTKVFDWNKASVYQVGECPLPYYSLRLVKDFDGTNYYGAEYIGGVLYSTVLHAESGQIWLSVNYGSKGGLIPYESCDKAPDYVEVNNGEVPNKRIEYCLNEWNGRYWEKKFLSEGDTVVIEDSTFDKSSGMTTDVSWIDSEGVEHTVEVVIPKVAQYDIEYRIYTKEGSCDQVLVNTDDLVVERVVNVLIPFIESEREERIAEDEKLNQKIENETYARMVADDCIIEKIDEEKRERMLADAALSDRIDEIESATSEDIEALWEALSAETSARTAADEALQVAIEDEIADRMSGDDYLASLIEDEVSARTAADEVLQEAIDKETSARTAADEVLQETIDEEVARAVAREDEIDGQLIDASEEYTLRLGEGLVLKQKNGGEITIAVDGDFGQI